MCNRHSRSLPRWSPASRAVVRVGLLLVAMLGLTTLPVAMADEPSQPSQPSPLTDAPAATATAPDSPDGQRIVVHRNGATGLTVAVTLGLPLPPGTLTDPDRLSLYDGAGEEIPAHAEPTLRWHSVDDSIRALRVQFRLPIDGESQAIRFRLDVPRTRSIEPWPYTDGLVDGDHHLRVPGALATLSPAWLTASLIAGPQVPFDVETNAYDRYLARQFVWARALPTTDPHAWLFDRTSTLFKLYVRSGDIEHLRAAVGSYRFYMSKLIRTGAASGATCIGGWAFAAVNSCDVKYVYVEPILLALGLTGDGSLHDDTLVKHMVMLWDSGGWSGIPAGPYTRADQVFTERHIGLGLLETVKAWELTGSTDYRQRVDQRVGWLIDHQRTNPDGQPADGAWRHSWQRHEGDEYDPATDIRGASPWMSENIVDGLWQTWLVTGDARIPGMLTAFGQYLETHGWIAPSTFVKAGESWRDDCSGEAGEIAWYWSSSLADLDTLIRTQGLDGMYSDAHTVELALPVAAAWYFQTDANHRAALSRRLKGIAHSYTDSCAGSRKPPRRFNWNNRGAGVVQWLVRQTAGAVRRSPMAGAASTR